MNLSVVAQTETVVWSVSHLGIKVNVINTTRLNVCVYVCVCTHVHVHVCVCVCIHMYMCVCVCVCVCVCDWVDGWVGGWVGVSVHACRCQFSPCAIPLSTRDCNT